MWLPGALAKSSPPRAQLRLTVCHQAWAWQPCCGRRGSWERKDSRDIKGLTCGACHPGESGSDGSSTLPGGMHGQEQARSTQVSR